MVIMYAAAVKLGSFLSKVHTVAVSFVVLYTSTLLPHPTRQGAIKPRLRPHHSAQLFPRQKPPCGLKP